MEWQIVCFKGFWTKVGELGIIHADMVAILSQLCENPKFIQGRTKPLGGKPDLYRYTISYRIRLLYKVDEAQRKVFILNVGQREGFYK